MAAGVGADVESLCSKCGDVWHVVVAKHADGRIAKVQCKQCGGYHRYKSVVGATAEAKMPANKRPPKEPRAPRDPVERFEKPAVQPNSKPARPYRASEKFDVGDSIEHPNFGRGIVELCETGKITVFFATGRRVLVCAK